MTLLALVLDFGGAFNRGEKRQSNPKGPETARGRPSAWRTLNRPRQPVGGTVDHSPSAVPCPGRLVTIVVMTLIADSGIVS